jgi:O-antigen/teichoic acid export membrane protein
VRFGDFLRTAVLLFGAAATACAIVAVAGARAKDDSSVLYLALGWWVAAALIGLWFGRRREASEGIARLLSDARTTPLLPELEPGTVLFNRLWSFGIVTVIAGALAFLFPQVPAIWTGFTLMVGLAWRKQPSAVLAIEERDGVRFYVERVSPFKPTRLLRTPGFRKNEPAPTDVQRTSA